MMARVLGIVMVLVAANSVSAEAAADPLKSGPQVGQPLPVPFYPLVIFHADKLNIAGKKWDFVEAYGSDPVVLVVARSIVPCFNHLVAGLEAEVANNKQSGDRFHAVVVVLSDDDGMEKKLKDFALEHHVR